MVGLSTRAGRGAVAVSVLVACSGMPAVAVTSSRTMTVGAYVVASCAITQETIARLARTQAFAAPSCQAAAPLSAITAPPPRLLLTNTRAGTRRLTFEF